MRRVGAAVLTTLFVWTIVTPDKILFADALHWGDSGAAYASYSFSVGIDGDLDFANEVAFRLNEYPNGRVLPVHPPGPGLLASPMVGGFALLDRVTEHPVLASRFQAAGSWALFGHFFASLGALLAGVYLAIRAAREVNQSRQTRLSAALLLLMIAGTGLPYYGLDSYIAGHSFEFLASGLLLFGSVRLGGKDSRFLIPGLLVTLGIALSLLVRPANVNLLLLPFITQLAVGIIQRFPYTRTQFLQTVTAVMLGVFLVVSANIVLYGNPYPSLSAQYTGSSSRPSPVLAEPTTPSASMAWVSEIPNRSLSGHVSLFFSDTAMRAARAAGEFQDLQTILFSQEFGITYFMPLVTFGGLLLKLSLLLLWRERAFRKRALLLGALCTMYASVPFAVVLNWQSHASGFGFRYLFSLVPLGLLGLLLADSLCRQAASRLVFRTVLVLTLGFSLFSLLGQAFYYSSPGLIPTYGVNSFGITRGGVSPNFATALLSDLLNTSAWLQVLGRGFLGTLGFIVLPSSLFALLDKNITVNLARDEFDTLFELATGYPQLLDQASPGVLPMVLLTIGFLVPMVTLWLGRDSTYEADKMFGLVDK